MLTLTLVDLPVAYRLNWIDQCDVGDAIFSWTIASWFAYASSSTVTTDIIFIAQAPSSFVLIIPISPSKCASKPI